uniref:Protein tyrosine phosphatase, non-receptor type 23, a n=1 Tax=Callorhinchus milii TaxID=7868 RepID=A0A4W3HRK0_CALMI
MLRSASRLLNYVIRRNTKREDNYCDIFMQRANLMCWITLYAEAFSLGYILKHYGENPDNYNEELKKLDQLRQSAVNVTRDFEGCSTLRKYFGQLHYLQSRIPMGSGQEAAVPITWTEIFSGKTVTVDEICYEQACILYNLGALHSMLGAMDSRVTEEGMKVSCTHFQCSAGAFSYLRDHFSHSYSMDMSHQILNLNINLMLGQAQECLLEKSMLDNRKSFLVARISAQVVDYYKEACRALENSETASLIGKFQKDWKKLVQMKIYYYAAVAHLHLGKQAEEQQKYGERALYRMQRLLLLLFCGRFISGVNVLETLQVASSDPVPAVLTGASLVKALPVNPTDPSVTGTDIFSKLVPMEAHEASSLYSEEKAKLLREVVSKIESKNEALEQFMDSLRIDVETVDNLNQYSHIPPVLMEKCAALSVRPDTVKNLIQSMQVLSGVYTDVEASLRELKELIDQDELSEQKLQELFGKRPAPGGAAELSKEWARYMEVHEKASFTNTELHKAMNQHISNLRLLSGPLEQLRAALPTPVVSEEEKGVLHNMKRLLAKVEEMRDQRTSLEQQLRDTIQKDDITTTLVTTDHSEMKVGTFPSPGIIRSLSHKALRGAHCKVHQLHTMLVASFEAYEDLMKKSQEGKEFYADLEGKVTRLLEKARDICKSQEEQRQQILEREIAKKPPPRPTAPKPVAKASEADRESLSSAEDLDLQQLHAALSYSDLPEDLKSLPPDVLAAQLNAVAVNGMGLYPAEPGGFLGQRPPGPEAYLPAHRQDAPTLRLPRSSPAASSSGGVIGGLPHCIVPLFQQKVIRHLPTERGQQLVHGPITLTLTTQKITQTHVERMIGLQYREQSLKRTIIHLQFTSWPELGLPDSKSNLLRFIQEVHAHYLHQRPLHTPIVVHCSSGVGRTGGFCLLYAALQEVEAGNGIPDLLRIIRKMRQQRKHMLYEKLHLKFCYEVLLKHVEQVLQRHGVTTATSKATGSSAQKVYARQESQDLVLGGDLPISSIQATIAKLSIRSAAAGGPGARGEKSEPWEGRSDLPWSRRPRPASRGGQGARDPPLAPQGPGGEEGDNSRASSLDLLASLTAEAFAMDSNPRNRQKISKENFLQPPSGQSLQPRPASADPLNLLDPLWTLNKT